MPSASVTGAAYHGVAARSGSPDAMLPVHVSKATAPPNGSGWLSGSVPCIVKPHAQAVRRDPQLPTMARQWMRRRGTPQPPTSKPCRHTRRTARAISPCPRASGCRPKPSSPTVAVAPGRRSMVPAKRRRPEPSTHSMAQDRTPCGSAQRGSVPLDPPQRVGGGVLAWHGRPALALGVETLLDDGVDVVRGVRAQAHDAVGERGGGVGAHPHHPRIRDPTPPPSTCVVSSSQPAGTVAARTARAVDVEDRESSPADSRSRLVRIPSTGCEPSPTVAELCRSPARVAQ